MPTSDELRAALSDLRDPETGRPISKTQQIGDLHIDGQSIRCTIKLSTHSWPIKDHFASQVEDRLRSKSPAATQIAVDIEELDRPPAPLGQLGMSVKSVIAVGSGKGGVGKSTVAASLALSLLKAGARVGLMDADVYGPSIPHLLGLSGRPEVQNGKVQPIFFRPHASHVDGLSRRTRSSRHLAWPDAARGDHSVPSRHLLGSARLPDYRYASRYRRHRSDTLANDPLAGAVVVCTPQQVALLDAVKAVAMFRKTHIPLLGMVENMSGFICPDCGKRYDIFGHGGAREKAEQLNVPFLGEVPLNMQLRSQSDDGNLATALQDPICKTAFDKIVFSLISGLALRAATAPVGAALPVL